MGNGYDDAQLKEKRHPIAIELDQISKRSASLDSASISHR